MKPVHAFGLLCIIAVLVAFSGCTSTPPPAPAPVVTPGPVIVTTTATPVPEPTVYPGALALKAEAPFGIAGKSGTATVYKAETHPTYTWSSPSYNSAHEQLEAGESLYGTQKGYNTEQPKEGNTFLFVYVRLTDTGSDRMVAPSPNQFVVDFNGKTYAYTSLRGSDVTVGTVRGTQYDYLIGKGGAAGYIQPGASNAADGFLIYEVPKAIDLSKAAMVITLDSAHQSAWKLA
jgi:hypothetical protein